MVKKYLGIVVAVSFIFCIGISNIEGVTRTWDGGGVDNNWSTPANWSGDTLPDTADDVVFDGATKNCTIGSAVTVASISINSGYVDGITTGIITQNNGVNVTVSGNFTQLAGKWNIGVNTATTLTINGTLNKTGGALEGYYTVGSIVLNGNATFSGGTTLFYNMTCSSGTNTTTVNSYVDINVTLTIGTGTLTGSNTIRVRSGSVPIVAPGNYINPGQISCSIEYMSYGNGTIYVTSGYYAILSLLSSNPGGPIDKVVLSGNIVCTNLTINNSVYRGVPSCDTAGYSITASSITITNYAHLKCNGSTINVSGNVDSGSAFSTIIDADSSTWTIGESLIKTGAGTFNLNTGTSTFVFTNNNTLLTGITWYNLTAGGTGKTLTLGENTTVTNNLTVGSGATLNPVTYTVTVNGNLVNNSTSTFSSTQLTLNGGLTNNGTLTTSNLTIPLNKQALLNAGSVWNITSGSTLTVLGTLKSSGTSTSMALIQSSSTSGYTGISTNGGSIDLTGAKLYYLNKDGLKIDRTGTITKMDNVEIKYGETGGTHLQVLNGQSVTITNMVFDDITNGTNITVKNNTKLKVSKYKRGRNRDSIESGSSITWISAEQSIKPAEGGRITSTEDPLTYIDIPKDVLKKEMTFTLAKVYLEELPLASEPAKVVYAYTIDAVDNEGKEVKILDGPITLVIHTSTDGTNVLDSSGLSTGIKVSEASNRLSIGYWNERYWVKLGGRVERSSDDRDVTVSCKVSHLSKYAIITKEGSSIVVTNVSPNPFTPASSDSRFNRVTFSFNNENNEEVELKIWDLTAGLVRTIREYGTSSISWDGRNEYGEIVEGGVYIWQLKVGNNVAGRGTVVVGK